MVNYSFETLSLSKMTSFMKSEGLSISLCAKLVGVSYNIILGDFPARIAA